jgi:hypothetical protein
LVAVSPLVELVDRIGGGFCFWWEVLYASNNNTSTDFRLNLNTNYSMMEVVEIVKVSYLFFSEAY